MRPWLPDTIFTLSMFGRGSLVAGRERSLVSLKGKNCFLENDLQNLSKSTCWMEKAADQLRRTISVECETRNWIGKSCDEQVEYILINFNGNKSLMPSLQSASVSAFQQVDSRRIVTWVVFSVKVRTNFKQSKFHPKGQKCRFLMATQQRDVKICLKLVQKVTSCLSRKSSCPGEWQDKYD